MYVCVCVCVIENTRANLLYIDEVIGIILKVAYEIHMNSLDSIVL